MARPKVPSPAPVAEDEFAPEAIVAPSKRTDGDIQRLRQGRHQRMKEYFAERPRVPVRIRKEDGDQTVQINGYPFTIQAGAEVMVPVDVRDLLRGADLV